MSAEGKTTEQGQLLPLVTNEHPRQTVVDQRLVNDSHTLGLSGTG